jgi:uncharacterized LabA/DUF88 family protein
MNITTTSLSHLGIVAGIFDELGIAALGQKCRRIAVGFRDKSIKKSRNLLNAKIILSQGLLSRKLYILIITIYYLDLPLPVSADTGRLDYLDFFYMERAAVFIDGGYFDTVLLTFGRLRIDYHKFAELICGDCERFRTYYYHAMPYQSSHPSPEESSNYANMHRFITVLKRLPRFEVRLGKVVKYGDGDPHQKQVDTLIAIDLVKLSAKSHIQKAIIIAGDSDHLPAVKAAKEEGVICELYYLSKNLKGDYTVSRDLFDICDDRFQITKELLLQCER